MLLPNALDVITLCISPKMNVVAQLAFKLTWLVFCLKAYQPFSGHLMAN